MLVTEASSPAQHIAAGYAFSTAALELGAVSVAGQVDPAAKIRIPLSMMNRHGLVAGATGTGKTKTLQLIAEQHHPVRVVQPALGRREVVFRPI